jgi:hypothetical protein
MNKKQVRDKKAEKKADQTVKLLFLSLVVLGLILMIWFSLS